MKKLDVKIWRKKNVVIAEVAHMDESLKDIGTLAENSEYSITASSSIPFVFNDGLGVCRKHICGESLVSSFAFLKEKEAIRWCKNITSLINEINEESKEETTDDGFIRVL